MGHPQPPTPIKTDNSTTAGFANKNIQLKKSKSWDMRMHWVRDKQQQGEFDVYWESGPNNNVDYYTKHHVIKHHRAKRPLYVIDVFENLKDNILSVISRIPSR